MKKLILRASQVGSTKSEKYRDVFMEGLVSRVSQGLSNGYRTHVTICGPI